MDVDMIEIQDVVTKNDNNEIYYKLSIPLREQKTVTEYRDLLHSLDATVTKEFFEDFLVNLNGWNSTIEIKNIPRVIPRRDAIHNVLELLRSTYPTLQSMAKESVDQETGIDSLAQMFPIIFNVYESLLNNNNIDQIIPTLYSYENAKHTFDYNDYIHRKGELLSSISLILKSTIGFNVETNVLLPLTNTEYITTTIYILLLILNTNIIDAEVKLLDNILTPTRITMNILGCTIFNIFTDKCSKVLWIDETTRPAISKQILSDIYNKFPQLLHLRCENDINKIQPIHHSLENYLREKPEIQNYNLYPYILTFNFNDKHRILFNVKNIVDNLNAEMCNKNKKLEPENRTKLLGPDFPMQVYNLMETYIIENKNHDNTIFFNESFLFKLKSLDGFTSILMNYMPSN